MQPPKVPKNESARLAELKSLAILDTPAEQAYDQITEILAEALDVPIALVSLVDENRQWFKSKRGMFAAETPRDLSFCGHVVESDAPLVVEDASKDSRFADNPLVSGAPDIRFYAGWPLKTKSGNVLGTLCAIDKRPRTLSAQQSKLLTYLASQISLVIELRRQSFEADRYLQKMASINSELARSNEDLRQFAYIASHDLQTPLRHIGTYVDFIQEDLGESAALDVKEGLGIVRESVIRMRSMIDDILTYASAGSREMSLSRQDLGTLVKTAMGAIGEDITAAGAQIIIDPMPEVKCDGEQLTLVFQNIIHNAIKYRRPDAAPIVSLSARQDGDYVIIIIEDNGLGIAPEYRAIVFKVFQRLPGVSKMPGTGIGLAICKTIVERHGGRIWVESAPEQGSRLCFSIQNGAAK